MKNPGFTTGVYDYQEDNITASGEPYPCERTIQNNAVHFPKLSVTPASELSYLLGNEHFNGFGQLLFEQTSIKTHLLKDRFDVFKHGKHRVTFFWMKKSGVFKRMNTSFVTLILYP